ncbi:hypothetical protein ACNKHV_05205 [Shigella flexneri]
MVTIAEKTGGWILTFTFPINCTRCDDTWVDEDEYEMTKSTKMKTTANSMNHAVPVFFAAR